MRHNQKSLALIAEMKTKQFKAPAVSDPRLALHATSALPAWLWAIDGTHLVWANPVGAHLFGAYSGANLGKKRFGPADPHRRQVMQLARRLSPTGAVRMERLKGFGGPLGTLATCACARLDLADGEQGILIVAADPLPRAMPLAERLQRLVNDADEPVAAFASDGAFVAASAAANALFNFESLAEAGLEDARLAALKEARSEVPFGGGQMTLQRVGRGSDLGLLAFITPAEAQDGQTPTADDAAADLVVATKETPRQPDEFADALTKSDQASEPADEILPDASPATPSGGRAAPPPRRHPLRFMWQMSADGRFSLGSDAFTRLIGVHTAADFGRPWREIADQFGLDPEGLLLKAVATRETWSGIILNWPVDDGSRLPVELSGLPIHDAAQNFVGYRGFGVCRDLAGLARLDAVRSQEFFNDPPSADMMLSEIGLPAAAAWPVMEPLEPSIDAAVKGGPRPRSLRPRNQPIWKTRWIHTRKRRRRPRTSFRSALRASRTPRS